MYDSKHQISHYLKGEMRHVSLESFGQAQIHMLTLIVQEMSTNMKY